MKTRRKKRGRKIVGNSSFPFWKQVQTLRDSANALQPNVAGYVSFISVYRVIDFRNIGSAGHVAVIFHSAAIRRVLILIRTFASAASVIHNNADRRRRNDHVKADWHKLKYQMHE